MKSLELVPLKLSKAILIGSTLFLSSCASVHPAPTEQLESKQLVGHWTSDGDWMDIYCSGAISYEIKPGEYMLGELRAKKSTGGFIAELGEDHFTIGPYLPTKDTQKVQQWPHRVAKDGSVRMTVNDQEWTRKSYQPCHD